MKKAIFGFLFIALVVTASVVCVKYYSYIFARTVNGQIFQIERVTNPSLILGGGATDVTKSSEALYSFAVAVRTLDSEIVTASSQDRQWAVAKKGLCTEAKFYPYPPWNFEKSGTYFNARLVKLKECSEEYDQLTDLRKFDEPSSKASTKLPWQQNSAEDSVEAGEPAREVEADDDVATSEEDVHAAPSAEKAMVEENLEGKVSDKTSSNTESNVESNADEEVTLTDKIKEAAKSVAEKVGVVSDEKAELSSNETEPTSDSEK